MNAPLTGLVIETQRRHSVVQLADGTRLNCVSKGRQLQLACGDQVALSRTNDSEGVIETIADRASLFYRADAFKEKLVAANVTQVACIVAPLPAYADELLNRWLVCAEASGVKAIIGLNKVDLVEAAATANALAMYRDLGYDVVPFSAKFNHAPMRERLAGQRSVLIGQSGMGKSKLLNALVGEEAQRTNDISQALDSGKHTTTFTRLFTLASDDEWVIDSPGMQVFGLAHFSRTQIEQAFPEFRPVLGQCRFRDCKHLQEPNCALQEAVRTGTATINRLSYLRRFCSETEAVPHYERH
ncbi:MAG: ribosome small subunit-dependent GTPase A [Burkholderiales bacterium]|nr:ribosome small subunit-dependent GTPase A [Burkholderiales bacterium]